MVDQHFVHPIQKGLLDTYQVKVDVKTTLPPCPPPVDSISSMGEGSLWNKVLHIEPRDVCMYECTEKRPPDLSGELCLLMCEDRCCMNWTLYDKTDCISTKHTTCVKLHQLCLYTDTLRGLSCIIRSMTQWPVDFIIYESVNSSAKISMHLNWLGGMVDMHNVLLMNPNPFPVTVIMQEKENRVSNATNRHIPRKRGRKTIYRITGACQVSTDMTSGAVLCIAESTLKRWEVLTSCPKNPNYTVCIAGIKV